MTGEVKGMKWPLEDWGKGRLDGLEGASSPGRTLTLQGLDNIQWAIVIFMIGSAIDLALNIVEMLLLKGLTGIMIRFVIGIVFGLVSLLFLILAIIFLLRGIGKLKKGDLSTDQAYARDLRTSLIAIVIYLLLRNIVPFGMGLLLGPFTLMFRENLALTLTLTNASLRILGAFKNVAFIVMLTYPIGHLTSRRSLNLLITFAVVNFSVWVGTVLLFTSVNLMSLLGLSAAYSANMVLFYVMMFINLIGLILLLIAYRRTMASLKGNAQNDLREQRPFLPGFIRLTVTGTKSAIKPSRFLSVIIIMTILLITGSAVLEYASMARTFKVPSGDGSSKVLNGLLKTESYDLAREGELTQGESFEEEIDVGLPIVFVEVVLRWTDETPDRTWTNGPDSFNLKVGLRSGPGGETIETDERTDSNSKDGSGEIILSFSIGSESPERPSSIEVLVTLVESGDQYGSYLGLRTRVDDSNNFSLSIECVHLEE
ncbi:MAG: hypothetical protein MUC62_09105 [Candidatus Thermoplasmatota archaeon]|nr:hypothetical protein [Candidatus Thermoplasmatota archaeon]